MTQYLGITFNVNLDVMDENWELIKQAINGAIASSNIRQREPLTIRLFSNNLNGVDDLYDDRNRRVVPGLNASFLLFIPEPIDNGIQQADFITRFKQNFKTRLDIADNNFFNSVIWTNNVGRVEITLTDMLPSQQIQDAINQDQGQYQNQEPELD